MIEYKEHIIKTLKEGDNMNETAQIIMIVAQGLITILVGYFSIQQKIAIKKYKESNITKTY